MISMFRKDCRGDFLRGDDGAWYLWSRRNSWARAWRWVRHARFELGLWERGQGDERALAGLECLRIAQEERDLGRFRRRARRWLS